MGPKLAIFCPKARAWNSLIPTKQQRWPGGAWVKWGLWTPRYGNNWMLGYLKTTDCKKAISKAKSKPWIQTLVAQFGNTQPSQLKLDVHPPKYGTIEVLTHPHVSLMERRIICFRHCIDRSKLYLQLLQKEILSLIERAAVTIIDYQDYQVMRVPRRS